MLKSTLFALTILTLCSCSLIRPRAVHIDQNQPVMEADLVIPYIELQLPVTGSRQETIERTIENDRRFFLNLCSHLSLIEAVKDRQDQVFEPEPRLIDICKRLRE